MTDYTNLIDKINIPKLVKALRYHMDPNVEDCDECPYRPFRETYGKCTDMMIGDAADAIEALQAEVDEAKQHNTNLLNMKEMTKEEENEILEYIRTTSIGPLEPMLIEQLPKRGKWKCSYPEIEPNPMFMYGICSICGFQQSISSKLNYCPNCGAKMEVQE